MSTEEKKALEGNKAIVRRAYLDGMSTRDIGIIEEVFPPEYVSHFPGQPPTRGVEPIKAVLQSFFDACPDIVFKVEDQLAEGDKVTTRWTARGTNLGEWRGFPPRGKGIIPTGRHVMFSATNIYLISGRRTGRGRVEHPRTVGRAGADRRRRRAGGDLVADPVRSHGRQLLDGKTNGKGREHGGDREDEGDCNARGGA